MHAQHIHPGNVYSVYAITLDGIPGKVYIGRTVDGKKRFRQHINTILKGNVKGCAGLVAAAFKEADLTPACIKFHVLESFLTIQEARAKEAEYIMKYRSYDKRYGWNSTTQASHINGVHVDTIAPPIPNFEEE